MTVLVLRALGLGDALTGVAALRGVRRAWPGHRVVLAAPQPIGQWLTDHGVVDAVLPTRGLSQLPWPWAGPGGAQDAPGCLAVNLHGRGPESHRVLQATRPDALVAFDSRAAGHIGPDWDGSEHEVLRWCRLVQSMGGRCGPEDLRLGPTDPLGGRSQVGGQAEVIVHPGAAAEARRWPASRWAQVVAALTAQGHRVVLTGSAAERGLCARVRQEAGQGDAVRSSAGELGLPALADLVSTARLLVSGDTGVAHLATAYGTPSVTLFGPTPPALWGPTIDLARHAVVWHGELDAPPRDPNAGHLDPALAQVPVDEVVAACESALTQLPATASETTTRSWPDRPARRSEVPSQARYARG
ncbi:ADP-heptose:LPS heptosyltransferase [Promicromonospora umidemergens]|uniref:Glycosyltransferase family 9 protein n=1 Tax=Promicromonospora umidemergens TaxID=629679 RepID=A0ABP8WXE8_9MICO|nr:glycosyltransferase family 9 protein [Promicromonospora umidemergens]MCP2283746.1 ADP-heptose:LPS heptosyltransferase [Promicromonospora umidemergens]